MTPRERLRKAQAIAAENNTLPEVFRLNPDGSQRHPFLASFALAQLPGLTQEIEEIRAALVSQDADAPTRERARERLELIRRRMSALEGS